MTDEKKALKEIEKQIKSAKQPNYFIRALKDNLNKIVILLISIVYITYGLFSFDKRDTTIIEIIGRIALSLFIGITIALCMRRDGVNSGRKSEDFQSAFKEYLSQKEVVAPNLDKLNAFCNIKNTQELNTAKKDFVESVGLNYKGWKNGYYETIDRSRLTDEQNHVLDNVDKIKIERLSPKDLLSDSPRMSDKKLAKYGRFGKTSEQFIKEKTVGNLVTSLLVSIVFGYYSITLLLDSKNIGEVIWNCFQLIMWISNGVIKYFDAKDFVINEYKETHVVTKTQYLKEFEAVIINNPTLLKKYNDEDDIDEFLKKKESEINGDNNKKEEPIGLNISEC